MMKKKIWKTSFAKLTLSFLVFGMLPLLVLSIVFFVRYTNSMEAVMVVNYAQINRYIGKNVENIIESVDRSMEGVYNYGVERRGDLGDILMNNELDQVEKTACIHQIMNHILTQSEYTESVRLITADGKIYRDFLGQEKTLQEAENDYTRFNPQKGSDKQQDLLILPGIREDAYCVNSDDYVFTLVRNVMDISSVEHVFEEPLATIYLTVNLNEIGDMIRHTGITDDAEIYIFDQEKQAYIYSSIPKDYELDQQSKGSFLYADRLEGEKGNLQVDDKWLFYEKLGTTNLYVITMLNQWTIRSLFLRNRIFFILVLAFSSFLILSLYMMFSRHMSEPHQRLKKAMEQIQTGNLDARVDPVSTGDEMEYLCHGFNQMAEDLQHNIEKVLMAQLYAREAELDALKMQIQPHYLYNTLDIIRMTALDQEDEITAELLEALAAQLHYVIGHHDDKVTLRQELEMLRTYFVIHKVRYENRIALQIEVEDRDQDLYILKMLLQPVVENAIKHGLREKEGPGTVLVRVTRQEDFLKILVMDDGVGMTDEQLAHMKEILRRDEIGYQDETGWVSVGMKNVFDRVRINCGDAYGFEISSVPGSGTIVTFWLPIWEGDEPCGE